MCPARTHLEIGFRIKNPYLFSRRLLIIWLSLPRPKMAPGGSTVTKGKSLSLCASQRFSTQTCMPHLQGNRPALGARHFQVINSQSRNPRANRQVGVTQWEPSLHREEELCWSQGWEPPGLLWIPQPLLLRSLFWSLGYIVLEIPFLIAWIFPPQLGGKLTERRDYALK